MEPNNPAHQGLLDGVRILDLSIWRPGPYATQLLAEIGADIVKVEPPGGDPMRVYPELFTSLHANKRSEMLDLKTAGGRERALELAADADVVIEGFRPGVAARLGVGYAEVRLVNPSIIYCSISGMGQYGDLATAPGHDLNYQAWAGSLSPDGGSPVVPAVPIADLSGGMAAALAICAALLRKFRSGEGEHIDVAMADVLATWTGAARPRAEGVDQSAKGVPGYGTFATSDGRHITLGVLTENHFWRALCGVLGLAAADLSFADRMARVDVLQAEIAEAIARRPRDEIAAALAAHDVPVAPVFDRSEMLTAPHFRQRDVVTSDPWCEVASGYPVRFADHPAARTSAPPALDEHRGQGFRPR